MIKSCLGHKKLHALEANCILKNIKSSVLSIIRQIELQTLVSKNIKIKTVQFATEGFGLISLNTCTDTNVHACNIPTCALKMHILSTCEHVFALQYSFCVI